MQQPPESTPVPAVTPPTLDPATWEDFEGFRETFLLYFPDPETNAALRKVADLLYTLILESPVVMPDQPEGWVRAQIRAAVADLRFLQGLLAFMGEDADATAHTPHEEHLCRLLGNRSLVLKHLADEIEEQLGPWRGEIEA
jgi:hypothetical protein